MIRVSAIPSNTVFAGKKQSKKTQNPVLSSAMDELKNLKFAKNDVKYVKKLGAEPPFKNGRQAYNFIKNNHIQVKFMQLPSNDVHAQWDSSNRTIKINENYQNTKSKAVKLAIAEAILHEAGHAKDLDGTSSIQEEINCLALNSMAHRTLNEKDPGIFEANDANILKNGVNLYSSIYFSNDLTGLVNKIRKSYGHLPVGDEKHPASDFAEAIKNGEPSFSVVA